MYGDVYIRPPRVYTEHVTTPIDPIEEELSEIESLGEDTNPLDYITGIICECDLNMREIELAILTEEYFILRETGHAAPISEGVRSLYEKAREQVEKAWDKMQKFFKDVLKKIEDTLRLDSRFLSQYRSKAKNKVIKYNIPKPLAHGTGTNFDISADQAVYDKNFAAYEKAARSIGEFFNADTIKDGEEDDQTLDKWKEQLSKVVKGDKSDTLDVGDMKSKFADEKSNYKGERQWVSIKGDVAISKFEDSMKAKDMIKKAYEKNKKVVVEQLRALKKLERSQKTGGIISNDTSKMTHDAVKACQWLLKIMNTDNKIMIKEINLKRKELKRIIVSCAASDSLVTNDSGSTVGKVEKVEVKNTGLDGGNNPPPTPPEDDQEKKAEEAQRQAEEEAKRKAEEARKQAEEAQRKADEEAKRKAEEAKRQAEEKKRKAEEAQRKAEEEAKRKAEEEAQRQSSNLLKKARLKIISTRDKKPDKTIKVTDSNNKTKKIKYKDIVSVDSVDDSFSDTLGAKAAKFVNNKMGTNVSAKRKITLTIKNDKDESETVTIDYNIGEDVDMIMNSLEIFEPISDVYF